MSHPKGGDAMKHYILRVLILTIVFLVVFTIKVK